MIERKHSDWRREKMVWLMLALPAAAVMAGVATLIIALRAGGQDSVPDPVRRSAQIQTGDLSADARATRLGLSGILRIDIETGAVAVELQPRPEATVLELHLIHPVDATADRSTSLTPGTDAWLGRVSDFDAGHAWRVRLAASDGNWRIHGRLPAGSRMTELKPALAEP